jgi:hypothetical protein
VCICVLYYCHRVATQLQLNKSYQVGANGRWESRTSVTRVSAVTYVHA